MAVQSGHLEVVQWLHEHSTEGRTEEAMDPAAASDHLEMMQWLHEHRTEGCSTEAMDAAVAQDHLHVVEWLHEHRTEGCAADAMVHTTLIRMLQWLYYHRSETRIPCGLDSAVVNGNFAKLQFLKDKNLAICAPNTVSCAVLDDDFEIFGWLRANYPRMVDMDALKREFASSDMTAVFFELESSRGT